MRAPLLITTFAVAVAVAQDHALTPGDIDVGRQIYRSNCIGCHGGEGTSVAGIDLGRRKFRLSTTDDDLVNVIINGVPGTGMPATALPPIRASFVVSYLKVMNDTKTRPSIAAARGDAARGAQLFRGQAGCSGCHRLRGEGGRSGPDLTDAGHLLRPIEIETAILEPDDQYPLGTRPVRALRQSGEAVTGLLLNQDTLSVQIIDREGSLRTLAKEGLKSVEPAPSWMPSYRGKLDAQQLADLLAFLTRQRGAF